MNRAQSATADPKRATSSHPSTRLRAGWRWFWVSVVALGVVSAAIAGTLYWQERMLRQAHRALAEGNAKRALGLVSYFLDSHPEHGAALAFKARALSLGGRPLEAVELYERVGAASVEDLHAWGQSYLEMQLWSRALPLLTQVLRLDPDEADALYEITSCRIRLGLLKEALESATQLAELPGQAAKGTLFQATIYQDLGNNTESLKAYQRVVELTADGRGLQIPPDELFMQFGQVLTVDGQSDAAIKWLKQSVALRPSPAGFFHLGNAYSQQGNAAEAVKAWQESLKLDQGGIPVYEALAGNALRQGNLEEAKKWLAPLERVAKVRRASAYLFQQLSVKQKDAAAVERWGKTTEELRQREQRRATLDQLLRDKPYGYWTAVVRAHRFAEQGNWRQAEDMMRELAPDAPDDPFVRDLDAAIKKREPLPSLDRLPLKTY